MVARLGHGHVQQAALFFSKLFFFRRCGGRKSRGVRPMFPQMVTRPASWRFLYFALRLRDLTMLNQINDHPRIKPSWGSMTRGESLTPSPPQSVSSLVRKKVTSAPRVVSGAVCSCLYPQREPAYAILAMYVLGRTRDRRARETRVKEDSSRRPLSCQRRIGIRSRPVSKGPRGRRRRQLRPSGPRSLLLMEYTM